MLSLEPVFLKLNVLYSGTGKGMKSLFVLSFIYCGLCTHECHMRASGGER